MRIAVLCVAVALLGCANGVFAPDEDAQAGGANRVRILGTVKGYNNDDPRIEISASGRVVQVAVTTYGGGCMSKGNTDARVSALYADVTPWDNTAPPGTGCTRQLVSVRHTARLQFDRAGKAFIRVHGLDASTANATKLRGDTIVVKRTVRVE
jgi:hypothetical protein